MPLIKCPECGKEISSKASSCPNCGSPINKFFNEEKYNILGKENLKICKKCGRKIQKRLGKCPYCGKNTNPVIEFIGMIIAILTILYVLYATGSFK